VQKALLEEERACSLHCFDRWDLSAELDGIRVCTEGIEGERATEAGQLLQLIVEISNALVSQGLDIQDIPQLPKSAQEVLTVVGLWCRSVGLSMGKPPCPWPRAIYPAIICSCFCLLDQL
jgi:hypothetical protein